MLRHYDVYEQVNYGVYMPKKRESFMDNEQENRENTILGNRCTETECFWLNLTIYHHFG